MSPDSEDEEAPEEVTFQSARNQAADTARKERQAAKREKDLLKEKRKLKQERFAEQKRKKLLDEDILQTVSALPEKQDEGECVAQDKGGALINQQKKKKPRKRELKPKISLQENYKVVHLEDCRHKNLQQQKAKEFIQNALYGQVKNRTTANEFLSVASKKSAVKKPAFQFTDQSWGEAEKKKSEKFNLLWRDRKKL
ncbi:nucleolar protein 7 [Xenopus laevis]|uniref:U3 small nucleolar RNA-associated protein NOL7 C-terminal domain-containing protein n=2 Tax=Xenopus laevis TaxID=8355 RepID=A0A974HG94_XENLA|nr:nucleolar protein 7 [Xenopus laevis]OCT76471.1 hypothetical protein XELAEV_18031672mg [Xenopus laevis]